MGTQACPACGNPLALAPGGSLRPLDDDAVARSRPSRGRDRDRDDDASIPSGGLQRPISDPDAMFRTPRPDADELASLSAVLGSTLKPRRRSNPRSPAVRLGDGERAGEQSTAPYAARMSVEELMDQAKNYVCRSCSTPVPLGHKFCGRCGASVPPEILATRTQFFGQLQQPGKAKLILIRGEGVEGLSYQLSAEQHIVGRSGQLVFPDDPFVSPVHANLFYRDDKLVVKDEGSLNGVYLRVRGTATVEFGQLILAGEQMFRVEGTPTPTDQPGPDGTYFYTSPKLPTALRIVQILQGGAEGMAVCARSGGLQIGREGGDLNFPGDLYMSASHCKIEESAGKATVTDLNSRNGTYVRIAKEKELSHGDYLFIGKKLLRVEITAA